MEVLKRGLSLSLVWIPAHKGILGNERADQVAKNASVSGFRQSFRLPATDLVSLAEDCLARQFKAHLDAAFRLKGIKYAQHFYNHKKRP